MTDKQVVEQLIRAHAVDPKNQFEVSMVEACKDMGTKPGHLYTDFGLPLDIGLSELQKKNPEFTRRQKIIVLDAALNWLIEHRRNSAATDKAIDRQRKVNRETMRRFLESGEAGLY